MHSWSWKIQRGSQLAQIAPLPLFEVICIFQLLRYSLPVKLSVVIITYNEEQNIQRTLESVRALVEGGRGEIIVVDSGSTDRTVEIAQSFHAKVFVEPWKGFASQKNSAIQKTAGDWILSLDADEALDEDLQKTLAELWEALTLYEKLHGEGADPVMVNDARAEIEKHIDGKTDGEFSGFSLKRKNFFLGRWMKHGGYWPDPKLRFFKKDAGAFEDRAVHEDVKVAGRTARIKSGALLHYAYPTLSSYIEHMNRYSSLGAEMAVARGRKGFGAFNIISRPLWTLLYNYWLRLGFLDGREGILLHHFHATYVSLKYAKVWELARKRKD
jgi:glycosyltransferase involved in cell wall biosynthesis